MTRIMIKIKSNLKVFLIKHKSIQCINRANVKRLKNFARKLQINVKDLRKKDAN